MKYLLIVGEASADLHASNLIKALKACDNDAEFRYIGGELMAEATGVPPLLHYRDLAFMGFMPVLRNLGVIRRAGQLIGETMVSFAPDVVIPVDYAGFNLRYVLPKAKELGIPVAYYIAPKLWAWKKGRMRQLRQYVDLLLCILPFEEQFFLKHGVAARYVGNPTVDAVRAQSLSPSSALPVVDTPYPGVASPSSPAFDTSASLSADSPPLVADAPPTRCTKDKVGGKPQIALLSGSRRQELRSNLGIMLRATASLSAKYRLVVAGAPGLTAEDYAPYLASYPDVQLRFGDTYSIISESCLALVTSGTATLETALLGTPMVVCYRMGGQRWLRWVWEHFFSVPYISLVNLILGKTAVPELIGGEVSVERLSLHFSSLLEDGQARAEQLQDFAELRTILGDEPASRQAASAILQLIETKSTTKRS